MHWERDALEKYHRDVTCIDQVDDLQRKLTKVVEESIKEMREHEDNDVKNSIANIVLDAFHDAAEKLSHSLGHSGVVNGHVEILHQRIAFKSYLANELNKTCLTDAGVAMGYLAKRERHLESV